MDLQLSGTTAIVTGASRGIGLATVEALTAEGVRVLGAARTVTRALEATGAVTVAADLGTAAGVQAVLDRALVDLGGVDLLVNNVGGGEDVGPADFTQLDDDHWQRMLDLNLLAAVRMCRGAMPSLVDRRGAVVNVSSIGAWQPTALTFAYDVAKAGLKAFGKILATEYGPRGVRVTTVSPGPVRTAIWEGEDGLGSRLAAAAGVGQEQFVAGIPSMLGMATGRIAEPEEVARLITFLLSPVVPSVTGSDHLIDGGAVRAA